MRKGRRGKRRTEQTEPFELLRMSVAQRGARRQAGGPSPSVRARPRSCRCF